VARETGETEAESNPRSEERAASSQAEIPGLLISCVVFKCHMTYDIPCGGSETIMLKS
jgi:hypothetical protein